jgi:hypothetical protein
MAPQNDRIIGNERNMKENVFRGILTAAIVKIAVPV